MATNAMAWARDKGLVRTNAVHGAEEFRVSTFESFTNKDVQSTKTTASVGADLEDSTNLHVICKHVPIAYIIGSTFMLQDAALIFEPPPISAEGAMMNHDFTYQDFLAT